MILIANIFIDFYYIYYINKLFKFILVIINLFKNINTYWINIIFY